MALFDKYEIIEVKNLVKNPRNYKQESEVLTEKFAQQVKKNGMMVNVVVREIRGGKYELIDGNHRLDILQEHKIKKVLAYNKGKISPKEADQIAAEINETKYESDFIKLGKLLLDSGKTSEELSKTLPFSVQEIEDLKEALTLDWDAITIQTAELDKEVEMPEIHTVFIKYPANREKDFTKKFNEFKKSVPYIEVS